MGGREVSVSLAHGVPADPVVDVALRGLILTITAFAVADPAGRVARAWYRVVERRVRAPQRVRLFVTLRPFQVTPPWQAFAGLGGMHAIAHSRWRGGAVVVDNDGAGRAAHARRSGFGAAAFEQGGVLRHLVRGVIPPRTEVEDAFGYASGALGWDLEIAPGCRPRSGTRGPVRRASRARARRPGRGPVASLDDARGVTRYWERKLPRSACACPAARNGVRATRLRTATAHILVNRDGPAIQPGPAALHAVVDPRRRHHVRGAAADGLHRRGARLPRLVRALPGAPTATCPCAVDRNGADWLPEHDSHGQLVFTLAEYFRFTGDRDFTAALWPAARRAVGYLEALRAQRLGPNSATPEQRARFGILPESASHEGYLAQPVHAYWDDFWALRGLRDARGAGAGAGRRGRRRARIEALRDALHRALYESIETTIATRALRLRPRLGGVGGLRSHRDRHRDRHDRRGAERLPPAALARTFDEYLAACAGGARGEIDWNNYSAYEIRILGALVRLGRRDDAHELLAFFLGDRRPQPWNQWPEISWRDPRSPGHLGDVPHAWIGAEYVLAVLGLFAYERPADDSLVLAAGISAAWLDAGEVGIVDLPTWWDGSATRCGDAGGTRSSSTSRRGCARPLGAL